MAFEDKVLKCRDCGSDFVFSAGEQEFYAEKGFENEPVRCKDCRQARKRDRGDNMGAPRQLYTVICSECGAETQVPFEPRNDKPVYCRACFEARR